MLFESLGIPHFATETDAVRGFMHLVRYREAQDLLMETPDSLPRDFAPDAATARRIVADALREGREWLDPLEANRLLTAYDIPVAPVTVARDARRGRSDGAADLRRGRHRRGEDPLAGHHP